MDNSPESEVNLEWQAIVGRCPLLRAYLAEPVVPDLWVVKINEEEEKIEEDIIVHYGKEWIYNSVIPLELVLDHAEILNPEHSADEKLGICCLLTEIGYEIGSYEDLDIVLEGIVSQIVSSGSLNPEILEENKEFGKAVGAMAAVLQVGIFLRLRNEEKEVNENNPFDKFIREDLDFGDLKG